MSLIYDRVLYSVLSGQWNDLTVFIGQTTEDILAKRIEQFVVNLNLQVNEDKIRHSHENLLLYLDHAVEQIPLTSIEC